jgi:hypothetical protein
MMPRNNALASHNGREIELQVLHCLGLDHLRHPVDSALRDTPIEIKSCQKYIEDRWHTTNRRSGRFLLDSDQHEYLLSNRGSYVFIVRDSSNIIKSRILRADVLGLKRFSGVLQMPWHKVIA